jgi:hypothetical protein
LHFCLRELCAEGVDPVGLDEAVNGAAEDGGFADAGLFAQRGENGGGVGGFDLYARGAGRLAPGRCWSSLIAPRATSLDI